MDFLNEDLASVPVSGIPEEFRKLSRFLPVIVLVPKSALHDKTTQNKPGVRQSITGLIDTSDVCDTRILSSMRQDLVRKERKEGHQ